MPYLGVERPSIALGVLKAALANASINSTVIYANLWFAERVGLDRYQSVVLSPTELMMGEWTFAAAAFGDEAPDDVSGYQRAVRWERGGRTEVQDYLLDLRAAAAGFVEEVAQRVLTLNPQVVGCTSVFQQNVASLALLKRVRQLAPDVVTMMGGANCEDVMGRALADAFDWIDFVVSGEADLLVSDLCRAALEYGREVPTGRLPYGVLTRDPDAAWRRSGSVPRASAPAMDDAPVPDYDDYFAALEASPIAPWIRPGLLLETARGCWWGQKHHCTFCGLNGRSMTFRSKSPERVVRELGELTGRYGLNDFEVVDNILDTAYLRTLLVTLARDQPGYRFMYETKANLSADQIRLLADAGVRWIQPGIESVDDRVLKLIDKGTSAIINVNLLKWARAYGVRVSWNLLFGVPGERDEWYAEMATWFPLIAHLQPPSSGLAIRFDRFSPYHREPERFGLNLRHGRLYDYVYPVGPATLDDLAYFFRDERTEVIQFLQRTPLTGGGIRAMLHAMMSWRELWEDALHDASRPANPLPVLRRHDDSEGGTRIVDTRPCAPAPEVHLDGLPLQVLDATATPRAPGAVVQAVRGMGARISERQVLDALSSLVGRRLVVELSGRVLSLPTTGPDPALPDAMRGFPGGYVDVEAYRRDGAASRSLAASASASGVPITSAVNT